jgi:hypothetical protein
MTVRNVAVAMVGMVGQLLLVVAVALHAQNRPTRSTCRDGHWLPPHELRTAEGYSVFLERPPVMPVLGKTFIVSMLAHTFDSTGRYVWPLAPAGAPGPRKMEEMALGVLEDSNAVSMLVPAPNDLPVLLIGAEATTDDAGIAHVVWASNDSTALASIILKRSLWHMAFDGLRWGKPERILTTPGTITWIESNRSSLTAGKQSLHLAVAISGEGIRYVRFANGHWTSHHVGLPASDAGYPNVAELSTGRVVVIAQGPVASKLTSSMSALYATRSDDGGAHWTRDNRISDSTSEPAFDAHLLRDADTLYAVWYQQTDARGEPALRTNFYRSPGRIHVARSSDGGIRWRHFAPTPLLATAGGLQALMQPDHSILVAVVDAANERVLTASWSHAWAPFLSHDAKPAPFNPTLGLDGAHRPVLTWGIRHTNDWLGTKVSAFVPCRR